MTLCLRELETGLQVSRLAQVLTCDRSNAIPQLHEPSLDLSFEASWRSQLEPRLLPSHTVNAWSFVDHGADPKWKET